MCVAKFGEKIKKLMEEKKITYRQLAEVSGLSTFTIHRVLNLETPSIQGSTYKALANGFGMSTTELDHYWRGSTAPSEHAVNGRGVPVINRTRAGQVHDYQDVGRDNYTHLPILAAETGDPDAFAVQVVGDSMAPEWSSGDYIICAPRAKVQPGDPCFVQLGPDAPVEGNTFKRVIPLSENRLELRADNQKYRPIIVNREHVVRVVKVVGKYTRYSWD